MPSLKSWPTALIFPICLITFAVFSEAAPESKDLHPDSLSVGAEYDGVTPDKGEVLLAGPVGIGTASPSDKLHVVGGNLVAGSTESSQPNLSIGGSGIQARTGLNFAGGLVLNSSGGSVGIGTAAPASHIQEDRVVLDLAAPAPAMVLHPAGSTFEGAVAADGSSLLLEAAGADEKGTNNILFRTRDVTHSRYQTVERMRVTGQGNVGIGTQAPQSPLEISAAGNNPLLRLSTPDSDSAQLYITGSKNHVASIGTDWKDTNTSFLYLTRDHSDAGRSWLVTAGDAPDYSFTIGHMGRGPALVIDSESACTGRFVNTSDARFKKNVAPLSGVLEKLQAVKGVSYEWAGSQPAPGYSDGARQIGVMAQELEKVYPELVVSSGGAKAVDYMRLTAVLVEAVKEQQREIEELREELKQFQALTKNR